MIPVWSVRNQTVSHANQKIFVEFVRKVSNFMKEAVTNATFPTVFNAQTIISVLNAQSNPRFTKVNASHVTFPTVSNAQRTMSV